MERDVRYFPKGLFPSGNFQRVFFKWQLSHEGKAAISQMYIFPSNNFPK